MSQILVDKDVWIDMKLALKLENEESRLYDGDPGRWATLLAKAEQARSTDG